MNTIIDFLNSHRTVRKYEDRSVDYTLLGKLIEAGCRASNTGNMQTYSIVVTTDSEIKQQLAPAHFNQPMVMQAPVVLTFCADFYRFSRWCELREADACYDNFQSFIGATIDAMLVAQNFTVAAESAGLGVCYLGTTTYNADQIIDVLHLPRLVVPITTLTVGYPSNDPDQTDRLPLSGIVHSETFHEFTDEDIDAIYSEKENSEFYKQFILENNKKTLAQVFTDVRYPRKNNEFFSEKFIEILEKQGFLK